MYLHLGGDRVVRLRDILAILNAGASAARAFAAQAEARGLLERAQDGPVHAYVVTRGRVYASPIASATLARRAVRVGQGDLDG